MGFKKRSEYLEKEYDVDNMILALYVWEFYDDHDEGVGTMIQMADEYGRLAALRVRIRQDIPTYE